MTPILAYLLGVLTTTFAFAATLWLLDFLLGQIPGPDDDFRHPERQPEIEFGSHEYR